MIKRAPAKAPHSHYWQYPWVQIQGKTPNETVVVRYCRDCGEKQMAVARNWRKATGDYARAEHYA